MSLSRPLLLAALALLAPGPGGEPRAPAAGSGEEEPPDAAVPATAGAAAQTAPGPGAEPPGEPPRGDLYVNDRFGYALRRPRDWTFRFEPGLDIVIVPERGDAEIQIVARTFFDIRFQQIPEGPVTLELRAGARAAGGAFEGLRRCMPAALREYLQLFWLDSYVSWHTNATAEEYAEFRIESRRALQLRGHGGVELVYTLQGKRRPGTQRIKTIIVAYDERICQLSYISRPGRFDDSVKDFHAVVNSLYLHRDRG